MTARKLATIFPKILANSFRDILYLPKQSEIIVCALFVFFSVNDSGMLFDEIIKPKKTII